MGSNNEVTAMLRLSLSGPSVTVKSDVTYTSYPVWFKDRNSESSFWTGGGVLYQISLALCSSRLDIEMTRTLFRPRTCYLF